MAGESLNRPLVLSTQLQVPRIAYLPFIVSDIRAHLAELVLNEREVQNIKEENWWFEDEFKGVIKWSVPSSMLARKATQMSQALAYRTSL